MIKFTWTIAIALILLNGCKKNTPDNLPTTSAGDFAGTYISATVAQVVSNKLITTKGISYDSTAIKALVGALTPGITLKGDKMIKPQVMILKVSPTGEADIDFSTEFQARTTFKGKIEDITADELIIRSPKTDTTFVSYHFSAFPFAKSISPDDKFSPVSTSTGYNNAGYLFSVKRQRLIHKGTDLYLPMLLYWYRFPTAYGQNLLYNCYDVANPDLQLILGLNEQVVVQELLIKLNKQ